MTGRRILASLILLAGTAPAMAWAQPGQPVPKPKPPIEVPWVGFPHLPVQVAFDYHKVLAELNLVLAKPCLTAKDQAAALAKAKEWIEYFLKYAKSGAARTDEAEREARDYASILNGKYEAIRKKPPCPQPGAAGTTPGTPGTGAGTPNTGGGQPGAAPTDGPKTCPDPQKITDARKKFQEANTAETVLEEKLAELRKDLAEQKKIQADYEASPKTPPTTMEEIDKVRDAQAAPAKIANLERDIADTIKAINAAHKASADAAEELRGYGADPFGPCEPPEDGFMMLPDPPKSQFAQQGGMGTGTKVGLGTGAAAAIVGVALAKGGGGYASPTASAPVAVAPPAVTPVPPTTTPPTTPQPPTTPPPPTAPTANDFAGRYTGPGTAVMNTCLFSPTTSIDARVTVTDNGNSLITWTKTHTNAGVTFTFTNVRLNIAGATSATFTGTTTQSIQGVSFNVTDNGAISGSTLTVVQTLRTTDGSCQVVYNITLTKQAG